MSASGLNYVINESLGSNERLLAYYDFTKYPNGNIGTTLNENGVYYGYISNQYPAINTGIFKAYVINAASYNQAEALTFTNQFWDTGYGELTSFNLNLVTDTGLIFNDMSALFDIEFNNMRHGVLFGSLSESAYYYDNKSIRGFKGFNFGINSRGKLFFQCYDGSGKAVYTANNIEVAKRNIISFSVGYNEVEISRFDYYNNAIQSEKFDINTSYIDQNQNFYIGGSEDYFSTFAEVSTPTFYHNLYQMAIISGYNSPELLMNLGSGLFGDYIYITGIQSTTNTITGYTSTPVYLSGVTGYESRVTGTFSINVSQFPTGTFVASSTQSKKEGERYYKYYSFNNGAFKTYYKEEVGFLTETGAYKYLPTGQNAYDTLGLQNANNLISGYTEINGYSTSGLSINLYGTFPVTGLTTTLSGIVKTPLYVQDSSQLLDISGISISGISSNFKKNYIYYMGERL